jgi:transcriptional regulator with XRE-family HTH domain
VTSGSVVISGFPEALRRRREQARVSREALADQVGRGAESVERWERGACQPSRSTALRIADALGCDLSDLGL